MMSETVCDAAQQAIIDRNFINWQGLPDGCQLTDLLPTPPIDLENRPIRHLGKRFRPTTVVPLTLDGYYRPKASFDGGQLVLIDGMNPELAGDVAALQAELGAPTAQLDWFYGTLPIKTGEWIYPQRGISLFLNTIFDKALHIALYRSTTTEIYLDTVRPRLRKTLRKKR